ncbi:MAG: hypothetical protein E6J34_16670 [Chloroflexi bacterium]|nr:MAG: hypothetical protein E6J34_16670 [Chloroflexota bacterium]
MKLLGEGEMALSALSLTWARNLLRYAPQKTVDAQFIAPAFFACITGEMHCKTTCDAAFCDKPSAMNCATTCDAAFQLNTRNLGPFTNNSTYKILVYHPHMVFFKNTTLQIHYSHD